MREKVKSYIKVSITEWLCAKCWGSGVHKRVASGLTKLTDRTNTSNYNPKYIIPRMNTMKKVWGCESKSGEPETVWGPRKRLTENNNVSAGSHEKRSHNQVSSGEEYWRPADQPGGRPGTGGGAGSTSTARRCFTSLTAIRVP